MTSEIDDLREELRTFRERLLSAIEKRSAEDCRRVVLPSGWTLLGLVQHLTLNDRYWLRWGIAGHEIAGTSVVNGACQVLLEDYVDTENEWLVAENLAPATLFARYRDEGRLADEALAGVDPDATPGHVDPVWLEWFGDGDLSNRSILLHVLQHNAEHGGHVDVAIELMNAGRAAS